MLLANFSPTEAALAILILLSPLVLGVVLLIVAGIFLAIGKRVVGLILLAPGAILFLLGLFLLALMLFG